MKLEHTDAWMHTTYSTQRWHSVRHCGRRYLKISGGIFHDMLCHDFDMLHFLTGQVSEAFL